MQGLYQDAPGQSVCKPCDVGKYVDSTGQVSCKPCPAVRSTFDFVCLTLNMLRADTRTRRAPSRALIALLESSAAWMAAITVCLALLVALLQARVIDSAILAIQ